MTLLSGDHFERDMFFQGQKLNCCCFFQKTHYLTQFFYAEHVRGGPVALQCSQPERSRIWPYAGSDCGLRTLKSIKYWKKIILLWARPILNVWSVLNPKKVVSCVSETSKWRPFWKRHVFSVPIAQRFFSFFKRHFFPLTFSRWTALRCSRRVKLFRWFYIHF